ncbi:bifunctional tRNA (5-methylaminomethyl-2-thiouridine)(34)-methyltransferase MnmD/FAD-dependent 5-carboxymethylaminomethyl-2-thiouridine(34) oxidoreductase MnmC [Flocculibacter collagenilyticus]|uniref:bifunctional tRNA (5-methylaminomethyl-2-thiouridine)(34)-methyltransferase MnmD/FAD-dependent 5-carboxymethylaminomethyl-2-thiouridine(34) oxidoreductase MnmC n=1 Tax=Flocculibacter collagenilyticus TaxID=2744479 RepID=UPI0018F73ED6|nr:bifunctional tRNA (5-methylaminomethyl-2-thiouridine)(34)-methyltransferase MnmD/FAD-dependent 5-carboxymethylaminomethyl-2-thiouridine(34) oxidoreductase MnmC [Flocculibacter collagenilyticus]
MSSSIKTAQIHFNEEGTPVADHFDDIYYSNADGLAESNYVFIQNNDIEQRLSEQQADSFVIAESGFGTGLNFLLTWQLFDQLREKNRSTVNTLHFISFEKYPLTPEDLVKALNNWPHLKKYSDELTCKYPLALPGCHRITLANGRVILDLWFGDIEDSVKQIAVNQSGLVDAWYLDGFAPSKNPDMWSTNLFNAMSKLGKPHSTFATFTAAGFVRRGLQEAGYEVTKIKGWGYKRESLRGSLNNKIDYQSAPDCYYRNSLTPRLNTQPHHVAIIGGGIASACLAYSLAQKNISSTIYCKDNELAKGASSNRQGALYPLLQSDFSILSQFYAHSYLYANRYYRDLAKNEMFSHDWCGVLQVGFNDKTRFKYQNIAQSNVWPKGFIDCLSPESAATIANIPLNYSGLFFPQGGWINPTSLTHALISAAKKLVNVTIKLNHKVTDIHNQKNKAEEDCDPNVNPNDSYWTLKIAEHPSLGKTQLTCNESTIILASGHLSSQFAISNAMPFQPVRGQVSHVVPTTLSENLATVLCYKGYMTPAYMGAHCVGATFNKDNESTETKLTDDEYNITTLQSCFEKHEWANSLTEIHSANAAIRCTTPDHLPIVGAVPNFAQLESSYHDIWKGLPHKRYSTDCDYPNLFIFAGLGARGLCSAPLLADMLAHQLCNQPLPLPQHLLDALHPARYKIKAMVRKEHL